jgi:hypothetical protein
MVLYHISLHCNIKTTSDYSAVLWSREDQLVDHCTKVVRMVRVHPPLVVWFLGPVSTQRTGPTLVFILLFF